MSEAALKLRQAETTRGGVALPGDYLALLKPRVMTLVVFTAFVGLYVAPGAIHPFLGVVVIFAIALGGGASGALNMWYDADIDAIMSRTRSRPIPSGRIAPETALAFGLVLAMISVLLLGMASNWLAAGLLAFTIFFYVVVYTVWLKRRTPQNIVIGGAAGALPPMIGYAAVTGSITLDSALLFAIIFFWTPPHFWALALVKSEDYAKAGVPMMPNSLGPDRTRAEILAYTLFLTPLALTPCLTGLGGALYGIGAAAAGILLIALSWRVFRIREGRAGFQAAMQLFGWSIVYLFTLFALLAIEHAAPDGALRSAGRYLFGAAS